MPKTVPVPEAFETAIAADDWERIEELWLDALDSSDLRVTELLEVRRRLWSAGQRSLGRTLLELLVETLEDRDDPRALVAAMRELVRLTKQPDRELLGRLEASFAAARASSPSLQAVLDRYQLPSSRKPLETMIAMERWLDHDSGTVVEVVGQGAGRVIELNLKLENLKVDVGGRRPVSVPFGAIERFVRVLPEGDFRRRRVEEPEALGSFVADSPGDALVAVLESLGEPADVAAIKTTLEGMVSTQAWSSWWTKARKHPQILSAGSGSRLRYSVSSSAESATETLLEELREANPSQRLTVARRLASRSSDSAAAAVLVLEESLPELESSAPGIAWETAGVVIDLSKNDDSPAAACRHRLAADSAPLQLLGGIADRAARVEALDALRAARPEEWIETWSEWLLHERHPAVLDRIATEIQTSGEQDTLDAILEAVFRNHVEHADQFVWACEAMVEPGCPESLRRRMTPSLLEKLPDALTKTEFAPLRARAKALLDGGKVAVRLILESASPRQAERFAARIARTSGVEDHRARLIEQAAQQAGAPREESEEPLFVATAAAVEAKRAQLKQLLEVEIPKTLKGINAAAAEGDLRENFEYHMLRDRQELQSARAAKVQRELGEVRILEPGTADTSRVNLGTVVHFDGGSDDHPPPLTILGSWDADVERRIFANGSDLAQRLLGSEIGDQVEVAGVSARISRITAWTGDSAKSG